MSAPEQLIYVVDDDQDFAASLTRLLRRTGYRAEPFSDPEALLLAYESAPAACVITDVMMGELDGFGFAERLRRIDAAASIIFMTGWPSTRAAVNAVRRFGGLDYLEKPIDEQRLLTSIAEGLEWSRQRRELQDRTSTLTPRETEVFGLLVRGYSSKAIARELNISPRTVEDHRSQIAAKTGTSNLAEMIALSSGQLMPTGIRDEPAD